MLRTLLIALCIVAFFVAPLAVAFIAIALVLGDATVALARRDESRCDVQRVALLALTRFRAPPAAALR